MKNFSRFLAVVLVLALSLTIFAGTSSKSAAQDKVTLEFWTAFPEWQVFVETAAEIYKETNPNVSVNVTLFPQRALEDKVAVALPAGDGPDLLELDKMALYPYYYYGDLAPLPADVVEFIQANYPEDGVNSVTAPDGEMFTFPWSASVKMMFYNIDYFEEAGLTAPPKDIYEMLEYGQKLTVYDENGNIERAGFDLRLSGGGFGTSQKYWTQVLVPLGVSVIEPSGDKWHASYNTEAGQEALKYYIDAVHKYKVDSFDFQSDAEAFGLGLTAMFQREAWVVGYMYENAPDVNFGVFPMPPGPDGTWATVGNTMGLSIPSASKHKDEAFAFGLFLMSDEMSKLMFATSGWQPWRTNIDYSELYVDRPQLKPFMDVLANPDITVYDYENIAPIYEIHARMADRLIAAFQREDLLDNPEGIKQVLDEAAEETNQVLDRDDLYAE